MKGKVSDVVDKIIAFFEKERFNLLTLFVWIFALSAIRLWTEAHLFNYPYKNFSYDYIFTYTHLIIFGYAVGIGAVLILKVLTKERIVKIVNLSALGGAIAIMPPLVDYFIFRRTEPYRYISMDRMMEMIARGQFNLFEFGGFGLLMEISLILILSSLYVYIKTRSPMKGIANFFLLFGFISFMVIPTLNPIIRIWSRGKYGNLTQPVLVVYFLLIALILLIILLRVCKKDFVSSIIKTFQPLTLIPFVIVALAGVFLAGHVSLGISPAYAGNVGTFGICLFAVFFVWSCNRMVLHMQDVRYGLSDKDKLISGGMLTMKQSVRIAVILGIIALALAFNLSVTESLLVLLAIVLGIAYSTRMVRTRKLLLSTIMGLEGVVVFFMGWFIPSYTVEGDYPPYLKFIKSSPALSNTALIAGLVIFCIFFIIGFVLSTKGYTPRPSRPKTKLSPFDFKERAKKK